MALSPLQPVSLQCESRVNPLGLDTPSPRLSWQLAGEGRARSQSACRILVATTAEGLAADTGDLWDTGKWGTCDSVLVAYAGRKLTSRQSCFWKVQVWDERDTVGEWSAPARWEMALLAERDWRAQWIADDAPAPAIPGAGAPPSPLLRKPFTVRKPVRSARAYVCGLGYYELTINGRKAGDHVLDPLFTRYDRHALYVTHDVTELLTPGENAIGVMLGNGWYNCHTPEVWSFAHAAWRDREKLLCQLEVTYADGTCETFASDASWKINAGPVVFDGLRNGEFYDARRELAGWDGPGYDDAAWRPVAVIPGPGGRLSAQALPIKVMHTLMPAAVNEIRPGVFVVDLGQNMTGWAQLRVTGPAGTEITLRYAERLKPDGDVDQEHIACFIKGGECQTDKYTLKGEGCEVWEPRFTYHGFRWIQVTGFPGRPTVDNFRGRVVHSAFDSAGEFACSNDLLNAIQKCTRWSYIGNFVGIPTDCPHREKNGWTGDASLAAETGLFNYHAAPAYAKWLQDFADEQRPSGQFPGIVPTGGWGYNWGSGPAWDSAYTHIPWYLYLYCGDLRILETHYAGMQRYVAFMGTMATNQLLSFGLGDWCPPAADPGGHACPATVTSTAYYYANCVILARVAELLGKKRDAATYAALAEAIRQAFNQAFYDPGTGSYRGDCQTSMACALYQGLVAPEQRDAVVQALVAAVRRADDHLDFGILGAKYVLNALTAAGRADVAYALATQTTAPSWGWWLGQGATTLWEAWEGTSSRNHIMFGDISAWMFKALGGLNPDPERPGFRNLIIRPELVADLAWAKAEHASPYGVVRSAWQVQAGRLAMSITLPVNCTAVVHVPVACPANVQESGQPVTLVRGVQFLRVEEGRCVFAIGSGSYCFSTELTAGVSLSLQAM